MGKQREIDFFFLILVCSLNIYMIFNFWCVCLALGVLVLRKCQKAKGYSFFFFPLILVCSLKIYKRLSFFFFGVCLVLGVWLLRKCGKAKGNRVFFFFDLFGF